MGNARYDAVVIGAGLGGASTAAHLSAVGQRVLLLERYGVLGGSSHVFRRQGKWEFDCGVHYIGDCGSTGTLPSLMRGLGLDDRIQWLPLDTDSFDTIIGPDLNLRTPVGWDNYHRSLLETFPEERRGLNRLVSIMRKLGEATSDRSLTPSSRSEALKALRRCGFAAPFALMPYASVLAMCGLKPRTMLALSVQTGALATLPTTLTAAMFAGYLQNFCGGGAYYPKGGGQIVTAGFAEVIRSHGGEIRTHTGVSRIVVEGGRATGVQLDDGEVIHAAAVVSNADPITTFTRLVDRKHLPATYRARIDRLRMSHPLINGFFGVEHDVRTQPNTNYFAIPTGDSVSSVADLLRFPRIASGRGYADGVSWARDFARHQPMFVQSSSRRDPSNHRAAPVGCSTIEVQTIAPYSPSLWGFDADDVASGNYRRNKGYLEVKKIVTDGMLARMEQAFPGASATVRVTELGTPASQQRFVGNSHGAPFGLAPSPSQTQVMRPGPTTPIKGLFLAGTSTPWGPGTEGSMISGQHVAGLIVGRDLPGEVRAGAVLSDRARLNSWPSDFDPLNACRASDDNAERTPS